MAFVVATCFLNVGKDTLDDGGWPSLWPFFLFHTFFTRCLGRENFQGAEGGGVYQG